jgi:hypothetical protein
MCGLLSSIPYSNPVRYEIIFKNPLTMETVETYDMHNFHQNTFGLIDLQIANPFGEISSSYIEFDDKKKDIDLNVLRKGLLVIIQGSKDKSTLPIHNYFHGFVEKSEMVENLRNGSLKYRFFNSGNMKKIYNTIGSYIVNPQYKNTRTGFANIDLKNEKYSIYNHLIKIFTDKDILVSKLGYNLQERGNFDLTLISDKLKEIYPSMYKPYMRVTDIINELANFAGCIWGVNEYNQVYFHHMQDLTLGHVLKTYESPNDNPNTTSIIQDDEAILRSSIDSNDGYYDINFGFVQRSDIYDMGGDVVNFASTWNKDLCVRVKAGTSRFRNLVLALMRVGAGTDANKPRNAFVSGHIANDDNGRPGDKIVASFRYPILDIPESPTLVTVEMSSKPNDIEVNSFYWIVLHERGNSELNTVRWYHDADIDVKYTDHYSGFRHIPGGRTNDQEAEIPVGWVVSSNGPVFNYAFVNFSTIPTVAYNPFTRNEAYGISPVETVTVVPWIKDHYSMNKFLNVMAFTGSEEPIFLQFEKCSIPNIPLRSGYTSLLYTNEIAKRERGGILGTTTNVSYKLTGINEEDAGPIGNTLCNIQFAGYFSQLDYKEDLNDEDPDF